MEPEALSPRLQHCATCPYPEPDQSTLKPPTSFFKIHSDTVLPYMPRSSKCSFPKFPQQIPVCTSPLLSSTPQVLPNHPVSFFFLWSIRKTFGEEYRSWSLLLLSSLYSSVTSSISGSTSISTLFSDTLSLCSSLRSSYTLYVLTTNCTLLYQAFPECSLVLISSWMHFWFVGIARKYLSFALIVRGFISYLQVV